MEKISYNKEQLINSILLHANKETGLEI